MTGKLFDVHTHFVPDVYRQAAIAAGWGKPDGMPGIPAWTERGMIEMMDAIGIERGILSISSPGVFFGDRTAARDLSRQVNLVGDALKQRWPDRLGLFASLPLPDVEAALAEIAFAYDELGVEGIYLQSNAGGIYPGDTAFEAVFAELDRRQAIVFLHPTSPACPCCGDRERPMPRPVLEFMFETTRVVTNLILSGTLDRYPGIKLIVPHGGATLPVLLDRIVWTAGMMPNMTDLKQKAIRQPSDAYTLILLVRQHRDNCPLCAHLRTRRDFSTEVIGLTHRSLLSPNCAKNWMFFSPMSLISGQ